MAFPPWASATRFTPILAGWQGRKPCPDRHRVVVRFSHPYGCAHRSKLPFASLPTARRADGKLLVSLLVSSRLMLAHFRLRRTAKLPNHYAHRTLLALIFTTYHLPSSSPNKQTYPPWVRAWPHLGLESHATYATLSLPLCSAYSSYDSAYRRTKLEVRN